MATLNNATALSEWFSRVNGLIIGCGEASALVVRHIVKGEAISTDELTQTIKSAINAGQTVGFNNAQTAANVQWDLAQGGVKSHAVYSPGDSLQNILDTALAKNEPVIIGTNYGAALSNETSGLRGHFITIVGKNSSGYVTADPNTPQATKGEFTLNTINQLKNSSPFAAIISDTAASGAGTSNPSDCGAMPLPSDPINFSKWVACMIANNKIPNPVNIPGDIGSGIATGVTTASQNIMSNFFKGLNVSGGRDLLWRIALVVLALILLIIGIIALSKDVIASDSGDTKVIPVPV